MGKGLYRERRNVAEPQSNVEDFGCEELAKTGAQKILAGAMEVESSFLRACVWGLRYGKVMAYVAVALAG